MKTKLRLISLFFKMSGSILFTPKRLGNLLVPNRFMRSATWEGFADQDGRPTRKLFQMITNLAAGNVGLIIPGAVYVTKRGQGMKGESGLCTLEQARMWKPEIDKIHKYGSKIVFQLIHNGTGADPNINGGFPPSCPTAFSKDQHELTNAEIEDLIQEFADSAQLAHYANADGVQIHGAHGFLLSEFLSPAMNHRTDKWGGSFENRLRIIKEIITEIRNRLSKEFSISIKINGDDYIKEGITPDLAAKYVNAIKKDIDFFEISSGGQYTILSTLDESVLTRGAPKEKRQHLIQSAKQAIGSTIFREMYSLDLVKAIRKANPDANLAIVGGVRKFSDMESVIKNGYADMVSMSRPFIHDPLLINKFRSGIITQSKCINCGSCLFNSEKGVYCHLPRI